MRIQGLIKVENKKAVKNGELVVDTKTFAIGGGQWSLEVYKSDGALMTEFVGRNGTYEDEPVDDLWAVFNEWCEQIHHVRGVLYECSDGFKGTIKQIIKEVERGRLHGCIYVA